MKPAGAGVWAMDSVQARRCARAAREKLDRIQTHRASQAQPGLNVRVISRRVQNKQVEVISDGALGGRVGGLPLSGGEPDQGSQQNLDRRRIERGV